MGLDMTLTAKRFYGGYSDEAGRNRVVAAAGDIPPVGADVSSVTLELEVAHWRKANAIHGWFVENVQDGEDKCEETFVSVDSIRELVALCEGVLDGAADPADLAPVDGFFFGPTDDDEWYRQYVADTVDQLKPLITWVDADPDRARQWDFYYRSSW